MSSRTKLSGAGLSEMHPSTIEVSGTTTAEPSGAGMERSAARATATESAAATRVTTADKTAATKSPPTATVSSRQYGWTEREQSRAHEAKYSFRFHSIRSRHRDLGAIARPLGFRMLPKSCRLLPLWSELPTRQLAASQSFRNHRLKADTIKSCRSRFRPGTPALLRQ